MSLINTTFITTADCIKSSINILDYFEWRFTYHTREEWVDLIGKERVKVNNQYALDCTTVNPGDRLEFQVVNYAEPDVPLDYKILAEPDDLLYVHKPAGLPVHRTGKIFYNTLVNLLRRQTHNSTLAPLHRLDAETSGITVFGRTVEALRTHSPKQGAAHWFKIYAAVISGAPKEPQGVLKNYVYTDISSPIRCQQHIGDHGKPAISYYYTLYKQQGKSLCLLFPFTGRRHQLRTQLAAINCPVIGDKIYSHSGYYYLERIKRTLTQEDFDRLGAKNHLLHCLCMIRQEEKDNAEIFDWNWGAEIESFYSAQKLQEWFAGGQWLSLKEKLTELRVQWEKDVHIS